VDEVVEETYEEVAEETYVEVVDEVVDETYVEVLEEEIDLEIIEEEIVEDEVDIVEADNEYPNYFRWDSLTDLGSGWASSGWFGTFYNNRNSNWIYHAELGWLFRSGTDAESMWLWSSEFGWLWTGSNVYPYFYSSARDSWISYKKETKNPRLFYDFKIKTWEAR
jgi:hypothetical protein